MHLDDDFAELIKAQKPRSLSLSAFCALLMEKGLDSSITLGFPETKGEGNTSTSSSLCIKETTKK